MRTVCPLAGSMRNNGGVNTNGASLVFGDDLGSPLSIHICTRPGLTPSLVRRMETSRSLEGNTMRVPLITTLAWAEAAIDASATHASKARAMPETLKQIRIFPPVGLLLVLIWPRKRPHRQIVKQKHGQGSTQVSANAAPPALACSAHQAGKKSQRKDNPACRCV